MRLATHRHLALLANAAVYDVERASRELVEDTWALPQGDVAPGDRGLIWRTLGSDGRRGVVSLFEVVSAPEENVEPATSMPYWLDPRPVRRGDSGCGMSARPICRCGSTPRTPVSSAN